MTFSDKFAALEGLLSAMPPNSVTLPDVERALGKPSLREADFLSLLSPAAAPLLEDMARKARQTTLKHFGHTILLYTPLYLANYCTNHCVYCGFNATHDIERRRLSLDEVKKEAEAIAETGLQHILILTGESNKHTPVSYIANCLRVLREYFSSISIEIYPLDTDGYANLIDAGADGLTIYQEVYDRAAYRRLHPRGPKRDYDYRLEAPERAGQAGIRTINIGALLGLHDWRTEVFAAGIHAAYLQDRFPDIEVSLSVPRMRSQFGGFEPEYPVSDRDLVRIILALRLFLPRAGITVSTRESASFRDRLVGLGVTKMSAGSSTVIGGHTDARNGTGQFDIVDERSVPEMRRVIAQLGHKPILKDWHDLGENRDYAKAEVS